MLRCTASILVRSGGSVVCNPQAGRANKGAAFVTVVMCSSVVPVVEEVPVEQVVVVF